MRRVIQDVPDSDVSFVVAVMKSDGATSINKVQQTNGSWTVTAVFPDRQALAHAASLAPPAQPRPATADDGSRAAEVLARTIWGEARGETTAGKEAVAAVVMNRLRSGRFGATVPEVCRQPKQFSCWNSDDPNRALLERLEPGTTGYDECLAIANHAISATLPDRTAGACFYHTVDSSPAWSRGKTPCCTIGRHLFFNDIA